MRILAFIVALTTMSFGAGTCRSPCPRRSRVHSRRRTLAPRSPPLRRSATAAALPSVWTARRMASGAACCTTQTARSIEVAEQVEEKELPPPVAAAMHSHPRAIYVSGLKVTRGGSVEYRLTVRGTRKTAMVAKPDGTVISFK